MRQRCLPDEKGIETGGDPARACHSNGSAASPTRRGLKHHDARDLYDLLSGQRCLPDEKGIET